jgi:hypothetical protein
LMICILIYLICTLCSLVNLQEKFFCKFKFHIHLESMLSSASRPHHIA